jgi:hypothetical protein
MTWLVACWFLKRARKKATYCIVLEYKFANGDRIQQVTMHISVVSSPNGIEEHHVVVKNKMLHKYMYVQLRETRTLVLVLVLYIHRIFNLDECHNRTGTCTHDAMM